MAERFKAGFTAPPAALHQFYYLKTINVFYEIYLSKVWGIPMALMSARKIHSTGSSTILQTLD